MVVAIASPFAVDDSGGRDSNMTLRLVSFCLAFWLLPLAPIHGYQERVNEPKGIPIDSDELSDINQCANDQNKDIVLRLTWYRAPYRKEYWMVTVSKDRSVHAVAVSVDWASAIAGHKTLSEPQMRRLDQLINQAHASATGSADVTESGKRHLAVTFWSGLAIKRLDYMGDLPGPVRDLVLFVVDDMPIAEQFQDASK